MARQGRRQSDGRTAGSASCFAGLHSTEPQVHWGRQLLEQHSELGRDGMVEHAIRRAMWRTAGTGALAGLGGVLTCQLGAVICSISYAEIELSAAIFAVFGVELDDEQHRPILLAAAMGLGVNEMVRLIGSRLGERAAATAGSALAKPANCCNGWWASGWSPI